MAAILFGALATLSAEQVVHADLLATESFLMADEEGSSGYQPGPLWGQGPTSVSGWPQGVAWRGTDRYRIKTEPMTLRGEAQGYPARGARGWYDPDGRDALKILQRPIDSHPSSKTYYIGVLLHPGWQFADFADANGYALVGYTGPFDENRFSDEHLGPAGALVGITGDYRSDKVDLVLRLTNPDGQIAWHTIMADVRPGPHLVVLKIEDGEATDSVAYWVDPSDLSSERAATDTAERSGTLAADCVRPDADLDRLSVVIQGWDRKFFFDELRLATNLEDLCHSAQEARPVWLIGYVGALIATGSGVYAYTRGWFWSRTDLKS